MQCDHCAYRFFMKDAYGHIQGPPWCGKTQKPLETAGVQVEPWCPLSQWRSVKDDPPTDGGWAWAGWQVVEIEGDPQVNLVDVSIDKSGYVWWYATEGQGYTELRKRPTHWMPLADWPLLPAPGLTP